MKLTESLIISNYLKKLTFKEKSALELKDDIFYDKKKKIVFSKDTYEENIHFLNSSVPKKFIKKIFRSSISDIICKGIAPKVYFLSLSIKKLNNKWLNSFTKCLKEDSKKYGLFLGGGDIVKSKKNSITISVLGYVTKKPILRSNAKINDDIYLTGNLGDSYLGLLVNLERLKTKDSNYFINAYQKPDLKYKFSKQMYKFANSSIDLSDGLIKDLSSICRSSNCGAILDYVTLPFSSKAKKLFKKNRIKPKHIFSQGDDYQILFTASKKLRGQILLISKKTTTKVTRVGKIVVGKVVKMTSGSKNMDLSGIKTGFIHRF